TFPRPQVQFTVKGRVAGKANFSKNIIDFNYAILSKHGDAFIDRTPAHEVAHFISYLIYGNKGAGHGPFWKSVMRRLGMRPERCHTYDLEGVIKGHKY